MTVQLPTLQENHWHYLLGTGITALVYWWLRSELTPRRVISIFETEGVLSARQILAWVLAIFTMCMLAAGRISPSQAESLLLIPLGLFGFGTLPKVADKLKAPTTVNARQVKAQVETDSLTMNGATVNDTIPPGGPKLY